MKATADIEDFALLRSDGMPTYHLASCADDADLRISHIIRGQDHLSNTFKHILIFEAAGVAAAAVRASSAAGRAGRNQALEAQARSGGQRDHLSRRGISAAKRSSTFCACWAGRRRTIANSLPLKELTELFSLEGINRANAVVNFKEPAATPEDTFDPKALWLNAEHIRALSRRRSARPFGAGRARSADSTSLRRRCSRSHRLLRERIRLLHEVLSVGRFLLCRSASRVRPCGTDSAEGRSAMALKALAKARDVLPGVEFKHDPLDQSLRAAAQELGLKAGQMFQPIRVAVCGKKNAPPLFETLEVLGKEKTLARIGQGIEKLK